MPSEGSLKRQRRLTKRGEEYVQSLPKTRRTDRERQHHTLEIDVSSECCILRPSVQSFADEPWLSPVLVMRILTRVYGHSHLLSVGTFTLALVHHSRLGLSASSI